MKTITIKQPWATLIAEGYKEYEFRSWKTTYRGPLLIHAGASVDKEAVERFKDMSLTYPLSRIIAMVNLEDCILVDDKINNELLKKNKKVYGVINYHGNYAWKLSDVKKIESKEYVKGQLGLWNKEI